MCTWSCLLIYSLYKHVMCDCIEAFLLGSRSVGAVDEHMAAHIIVQQSPSDAPHNAPSEEPAGH